MRGGDLLGISPPGFEGSRADYFIFNLSRFGETIRLLGARIELSFSYFLLRDFELCPQRIGHPVRQIRQAYE